MHPDPAFRADGDLLDMVAAIGFAHVFIATPDRPMVLHAPVTRHNDRLRFHVARANRAAAHLDGAPAIVSAQGPQGYLTPNWYTDPAQQVPTWNYVAVEVEGRVAVLNEVALLEQLDALAARHEPRDGPAPPWTRNKTEPARIVAMLRAIRGYELTPTGMRGTIKLSQNKPAVDRANVATALAETGNAALAEAVRTGR